MIFFYSWTEAQSTFMTAYLQFVLDVLQTTVVGM